MLFGFFKLEKNQYKLCKIMPTKSGSTTPLFYNLSHLHPLDISYVTSAYDHCICRQISNNPKTDIDLAELNHNTI